VQVLAGTHTAREARDAVPELVAAGAGSMENQLRTIRRRVQKETDPPLELSTPAAKPAAKPAANAKKRSTSGLPSGKRRRTDQVDAMAVAEHTRRRKKVEAHKEASSELAAAQAAGTSRAPLSTPHAIAERVSDKHELSPDSQLTSHTARCVSCS
jgi:hypothetical protein